LTSTEENLRRAVPEGDDFVSIGAERDAKGAREAKVGEFEVAFFVDEQILWFQVAVEDAMGVAVADAVEQLGGELLDLRYYPLALHMTLGSWS